MPKDISKNLEHFRGKTVEKKIKANGEPFVLKERRKKKCRPLVKRFEENIITFGVTIKAGSTIRG